MRAALRLPLVKPAGAGVRRPTLPGPLAYAADFSPLRRAVWRRRRAGSLTRDDRLLIEADSLSRQGTDGICARQFVSMHAYV